MIGNLFYFKEAQVGFRSTWTLCNATDKTISVRLNPSRVS